MPGCIALFIDDASFADFADRKAALALARGAIARGVRVVVLHDPTLEARLRIAAAAAAPIPSVETGAQESVAPVIFVLTGELPLNGLGDEAAGSDEESDDLVEWRGGGAEWEGVLAEVLAAQRVRLVVGFGNHERVRIARRAAETLGDDVLFFWSGAIEHGTRRIQMLGEGERSDVVGDIPIDLDDRGLDVDDRTRIANDLRAAARKVLEVQHILTEMFGRIERRADDLAR